MTTAGGGPNTIFFRIRPASPHRGQRRRDLFQRLALGVDGEQPRDDGGGEHENSSENIAAEDSRPRPAFDQPAENERRSDAADAGSDGVKDGDRHGANF